MINKITVTNYLNESLELELKHPEKSGLLVQDITGLGPGKANINSTEMATMDGSIYNSSKLGSRNIVFTFKLLGSPTIELTRQKTYKYFPIKKLVTILFETDERICQISGYVESNDPVMFSNQTSTQISIICTDPYFYSLEPNETIFSGVEPNFTFPFSNESTSEKLINVGDIIINQEQTVYYDGEGEVGIVINIHALGEFTNLSIYNYKTQETMIIDTNKLETLTGSPILPGDDIIISTVKGNKYAILLRNGVYTNILNCIDRNSNWFVLTKGDNLFIYTVSTGNTNIQFRIQNKIVYEGI